MKPNATPEALLSELRATAEAIDRLAAGLDAVAWQRRPSPDEWSLTEVACHLRDVECEVHRVRLERIAAGPDAFISPADPDPLVQARAYHEQDGPAALAAFLAARAETLAFLEALPAEIWDRTARHGLFGTTRFTELVSLIVEHDRAHVQQVRQLVAER